jgi:hypothetical protein
MNRWSQLAATYPGLGWEDVVVRLGITSPEVKAEIRAAILRIPHDTDIRASARIAAAGRDARERPPDF